MRRWIAMAGAVAIAASASAAAGAANVDLVTLPRRQAVQLTIYNSEDLTLVKETRSLTLKKGSNRLQFSWANTLIDPTSVEIRPLEHAADIEVTDTVFPGQKPQHLIWNIESKFEGQVKVEVTYFTSGLTWQMDYVATCDPGESAMRMRGYVRVFNNSGEEYDNAEIRMIVGTINLVEKIADLARRQGIAVPGSGTVELGLLRHDAAKDVAAKAEKAFAEDESVAETPMKTPKKMVKEGLSEYFMFSVAGTETVPNGWSKRMEAVKADGVKFDIVYRMRAYEYGDRPVRFFIWRNDDEHKLGESPLPDGLVRVFRDNGQGGLAYLGEKLLRYVPIKAEIEVNLGPDDLVVYEMRRDQVTRMNFAFDQWNNVTGWDAKQQAVHTIRNYREKPIAFELRLMLAGDVEYTSEVQTVLFDYRTTETKLSVGARGKKEYPCTTLVHQGTNAKQQRILLRDPAR